MRVLALTACTRHLQLLDPSRSDTSILAKAGWRASLEELGLLVKRLGCEADLVWFYEHLLARRLLRGRTLGPEAEARACDMLQVRPRSFSLCCYKGIVCPVMLLRQRFGSRAACRVFFSE